jgi:integrase
MARQVRNAKVNTRSARAKLAARKSPYWTSITRGCALGYRKGAKGGTWVEKLVRDGLRKEKTIGPADDALDPDGRTAISFAQAQEKAREWFATTAKEAVGEPGKPESYKVKNAVMDYMEWFKANRKSVRETQYNFDGFIIPALGEIEVQELTTGKIRSWLHQIADTPPRLRTRPGEPQRYRDITDDPDAKRKRRFTANHQLTSLKAALNHAWREGKVTDDAAWRRVKPFQGVDVARLRYLSRDECVRLVNACDPAFRPLVQAALFSGCRYGEITRFRVSDFNSDAGAVLIREAKSGKDRHVFLTDDGQRFFEIATAGKLSDDFIFAKSNGTQWGKSHQRRPLLEACERAKIKPPASFHVLRHTYASHLVMNGAPLAVLARNLGHSDTRMAEKHYAHLAPSYVADAIRAAAPALGLKTTTNVQSLHTAR